MPIDQKDLYPLSKNKSVKGTRRLAREKVMQIILAFEICETPLEDLFTHIYHRDFNFGDEEEKAGRLLRPEEILEMEADLPVNWKEEDIEFGMQLCKSTIDNRQLTDALIDEFAKNWEYERIAPIDRVLLQIAVTEFLSFPEIPPKVSINEVLDISKKYSTDKSKLFINGVLDSILDKFKKENKLQKEGRGLVDS